MQFNQPRSIIVFVCLLVSTFLFTFSAHAQTTLAAADISFVGYNSNNSGTAANSFSFVVLRNGGISTGTVINFTDRGWNPVTAALGAATGEGTIAWTATADLAQFTEVVLKTVTAGNSMEIISNGSATVTGTFILSSNGDQILAYQGTATSPVFISGIHMNREPVTGSSAKTDSSLWDHIVVTGGLSYNTNRSGMPPGIAVDLGAVMPSTAPAFFGAEVDNARLNCQFTTAGTLSALRSRLTQAASWDVQDLTPYTLPTGCTFQIIASPAITVQPKDSTTCQGEDISFTVTATYATSYSWQCNPGTGYVAVSNTAPYSGVFTNTLSITAVTAGMSGYKYRCIATGISSPAKTSTAAILTVVPTGSGLWLGGIDSLWQTPGNWSCGLVPTANTNVTINAGAPNIPIIDSFTATCNNLTIGAGASLNLKQAGVLDVKGLLTNNGNLLASGEIFFSGTNQPIPAGNYARLFINGSGIKPLGGPVNITDSLVLISGYIQTGSFDITIAGNGKIIGGNVSSFVITDNNGELKQDNIGAGGRTGNILFPIGTSASSYTPVNLANLGTADQFGARVVTGVSGAYDVNDNPSGAAQAVDNVNKIWLVTETNPGGSDVTLNFQWNAADEQPNFDRLNAFAKHYTGGAWTSGPLHQMASGNDPYFLSLSGITSFSPFGVGSTGSILPVHLMSFTGEAKNGVARLEWRSSNEENLDLYIIEKSSDGRSYTMVGSIDAYNEPGIHSYKFVDPAAINQVIYYRLNQLDFDHQYAYSGILALSGSQEQQLAILYPNPVTDQATLKVHLLKATNIELRLIDNTGAILKKWQRNPGPGSFSEMISLEHYKKGIYYLEIKNAGYQQKMKIIKQ